MPTDRRTVLFSALGAMSGCAGLVQVEERLRADPSTLIGEGWGPLTPQRDENTGLELLKLPEGFRYSSFGWTGDLMNSGDPTPPVHDGMAVIHAEGDRLTLMRNHELVWRNQPFSETVPAYDPARGAGTTALSFDQNQGRWIESWPTLSGTLANCAGGPTPWHTWLSCEEAVADLDGRLGPRFSNRTVELERQHGYVFEVPAKAEVNPEPLVHLGRFRHEAAAVDPETGVVYLTEDNGPESGVYRFVPDEPGNLRGGGLLQMLRVPDAPDLRFDIPQGRWLDAEWVDIDDPDAGHNPGTLDSAGVYRQGRLRGGSAFSRPEGCWMSNGRLFVSDTSGGNGQLGTLFCYDTREQRLMLMFESPDVDVLDYPDNLTVCPTTDMLVICEDPKRRIPRLQAVTPAGQIIRIAENNIRLNGERHGFKGDFRRAEWAGISFSPNGRWLFANVQQPGITFAITGPWSEGLGGTHRPGHEVAIAR